MAFRAVDRASPSTLIPNETARRRRTARGGTDLTRRRRRRRAKRPSSVGTARVARGDAPMMAAPLYDMMDMVLGSRGESFPRAGPARVAVRERARSKRQRDATKSATRAARRARRFFSSDELPRRTFHSGAESGGAGIVFARRGVPGERDRARASTRRRSRDRARGPRRVDGVAKAASGRRRVERRRRVRRGEGGREARERDGALRLPRHGEVVGAAEPARGHPATDRDARPGRRRGHHGHHLVRHADARVRVHVARGEALRGTDRAPSRGFPSQKTNRAPPHLPRFPSTNLRPAAPRVRRRRTCSR